MVPHCARSRADSQQLLLGLGAAGAVAIVALSALAYSVSTRRRRIAYSRTEWLNALEEIGVIRGFEYIVGEIADRGIEASIRPEVWPFLLEVFDHASSYQQRQQQHHVMVQQYQQMLLQCQAYEAAWKESVRTASPSQSATAAAPAVPGAQQQQQQQSRSPDQQHHIPQQQQASQLPDQVRQFAEAHRIIVIDAVRTDFQRHTAALAEMQSEGSSYFSSMRTSSSCDSPGPTGGYGSSFAAASGMSAVSTFVNQGLSSLQQYWLGSLLGGQAALWGHHQALWLSEAAQLVLDSSSHMVPDSRRQAARMIAMLSAYALHDPGTGYCQGMSDVLLPFLLLMEDDALAFWCFVACMQQQGMRKNFAVDESGIFSQLRSLQQVLEMADKPLMFRLHQLGAAECHFAYRMTIVRMRRDMPMHKVLQLWEVLWAKAWQQQHLQRSTALLAAAAAAPPAAAADQEVQTDNSATLALDSPRSASSSVTAKSHKTASEGGPIELSCDSKGSNIGSCRVQWQKGRVPNLFICFVAAVIISQRRQILDHCYDADDVLRLFHALKHVDVWLCLQKAQELQEVAVMQHGGVRQQHVWSATD